MNTKKEWSDLSVDEWRKLLEAALADAIQQTGGNTSSVPDNTPAPRRPLAD